MDFGKVKEADLADIDLSLPPDHPDTTALLQGLKKPKEQKVYVGAAKWGRKDWVGKLYPKGTKDKDFLGFYTKHFNSIELNATHYQLPPASWVERWVAQAGPGFRFCPKVVNTISHLRWLENVEEPTEEFIDRIKLFGDKLGMVFLQLSDRFTPKRMNTLKDYLSDWPKDIPLALELRSGEWFDADDKAYDDIFYFMRDKGVTSVITDTSGRRDVLHMRLTTPTAFIRFVGNNCHLTDYTRMDEWIDRITQWLEMNIHTIYFFLHQHDEKYTPEIANYFISNINKKAGLDLKEIKLIDGSENKLL